MDYKTILLVAILLGLPTIVLLMARLISVIRRLLGQTPENTAHGIERKSGDVEFGDGVSGKVPDTSDDETRSTYEHGGGAKPENPGLSAVEMHDYLEDAILCRDPAGKESFEKLLDEDNRSEEPEEKSQ